MNNAYTQDVFELVLARPVVLVGGEHDALVHVWWRSPMQGDRLVQVYVDQQLVDVTQDAAQREMWLLVDRHRAHRVELLAVPRDAGAAMEERRDMLQGWQPPVSCDGEVALVRNATLPVHARLAVNVDDGGLGDAALFPGDEPRGGFGALFGEGGFGRDDAAGFGLGRGQLGFGPLGEDGRAWQARIRSLPQGLHDVTIAAIDEQGIPLGESPVMEMESDELPMIAKDFNINQDAVMMWNA